MTVMVKLQRNKTRILRDANKAIVLAGRELASGNYSQSKHDRIVGSQIVKIQTVGEMFKD